MTSQEKKEVLLQYQRTEREVRDLEAELRRWRSRAEQMTAGYGPTPSGGGDGRSLERTVAHMDDLTRQLAQRLGRLVTLRQQTSSAIDNVADARLRELLRLRYIEGLSFEQIAVRMNYSWRHVIRLHGAALSQVVMECHI